MADQQLDVRPLPEPDQRPAVMARFDGLDVGESLVVIGGGDPRPLRDELEATRPGAYGWAGVDETSDSWQVRLTKVASTPLPQILGDTTSLGVGAGAVWTLPASPRDLDANIIHLPAGDGIDAHVGPDLDVLLLVLDGDGWLTTELAVLELRPGAIVWLPRRSRRQFLAGPRGLRYFSVHQRRQALALSPVRSTVDEGRTPGAAR
jgi:uncharacterized protein (DUF2249 family)